MVNFLDNYVVIDLETTGFSKENDKIIELGAVRVRNNKVVAYYEQLVNPGVKIPYKIESLTGISNEMVANAPFICDVIGDFLNFIGDDVVIVHNASFDINFIKHNCFSFNNKYIDTLSLSKELLNITHHNLSYIAKALDVEQPTAHRATIDCETTHFCYQKMKDIDSNVSSTIVSAKPSRGSLSKYNRTDFRNFTASQSIDVSNPFFEKKCVFTGNPEYFDSKKDIAQLLADLGAVGQNAVTTKTDYLIVGCEDGFKESKSIKWKKAEEFNQKGANIAIIKEYEFLCTLREHGIDILCSPEQFTENIEDMLELQKELGLTPKTFEEAKPLYYRKPLDSNKIEPCEFLGLVSRRPMVVKILVNNQEIDIALDFLKEMQPTKKEIDAYAVNV